MIDTEKLKATLSGWSEHIKTAIDSANSETTVNPFDELKHKLIGANAVVELLRQQQSDLENRVADIKAFIQEHEELFCPYKISSDVMRMNVNSLELHAKDTKREIRQMVNSMEAFKTNIMDVITSTVSAYHETYCG